MGTPSRSVVSSSSCSAVSRPVTASSPTSSASPTEPRGVGRHRDRVDRRRPRASASAMATFPSIVFLPASNSTEDPVVSSDSLLFCQSTSARTVASSSISMCGGCQSSHAARCARSTPNVKSRRPRRRLDSGGSEPNGPRASTRCPPTTPATSQREVLSSMLTAPSSPSPVTRTGPESQAPLVSRPLSSTNSAVSVWSPPRTRSNARAFATYKRGVFSDWVATAISALSIWRSMRGPSGRCARCTSTRRPSSLAS